MTQSDNDQGFGRCLTAASLEPVDSLADQIELQSVAARPLGRGDLDADVGARARTERLRQPRAREVAIDEAAVGLAQLRAEADQAAAVGGLRGERTRREVADARADGPLAPSP